jgi:hypothetical protein
MTLNPAISLTITFFHHTHTQKLIQHPLYLSTLMLNPYLYANPGLKKTTTKGVCHTVALPFTLKSILSQKKNYEKKKYNLKKIL